MRRLNLPAQVYLWVVLCLLFGFMTNQALARNSQTLESRISFFEDHNGQLTIEEVKALDRVGGFRPWSQDQGSLALGFVAHPVWVKLELNRDPDAPTEWVIEVAEAFLNHIELFGPHTPVIRTGNLESIESRPLLHRYFAFPISISSATETFYFRLQSEYTLAFPYEVLTHQDFEMKRQWSNLLQAMYFGSLIILAVYNFFLAASLKDSRFIWYGLYAIFIDLAVFAGNGYGRIFLWPNAPRWDAYSAYVLLSISGFLAASFSQTFLQTARIVPKLHLMLQVHRVAFILAAVGLLMAMEGWLEGQWLFQFMSLNALSCVLLFMAAGIFALRAQLQAIRYFILAWSVLWFGVVVAVLRQFDLIPTNAYTAFAVQISSGIELILLSLALADLIQHERHQRVRAQASALEANRKRMAELRETEQKLEQMVMRRTGQLESALRHERLLFEQFLKFGTLLSHEFRNPLGIIDSHASLIRKDPALSEDSRRRIEAIKGASSRLGRLFNDWLQTDQISNSLAEAFHPDRIDLVAWARDYVEQALVMRPNQILELRHKVSNLWVNADPRLLAVAIDNLLDNALKYCSPTLPVRIDIQISGRSAQISIIDCGPGIPEKDRFRVFEDYTRLQEGALSTEGTGLGLAFVRRIGEIHGGSVDLNAPESGLGCRFDLNLPLAEPPLLLDDPK